MRQQFSHDATGLVLHLYGVSHTMSANGSPDSSAAAPFVFLTAPISEMASAALLAAALSSAPTSDDSSDCECARPPLTAAFGVGIGVAREHLELTRPRSQRRLQRISPASGEAPAGEAALRRHRDRHLDPCGRR